MATKTETTKTPAARKTVNLVDRTKSALSTAALKNKVTVDELNALKAHIDKLAALLA